MAKRKLPHCDELFKTYFDPWYSDDQRERKGYTTTRPDLESLNGYDGDFAEESCVLTEEWKGLVSGQLKKMLEAAESDLLRYLPVKSPISLAWVEAFDQHYDRKRIYKVIQDSDPKDKSNDYVILCIEFGVILAEVLRQQEPRLKWLYDLPYWESRLVDPKTTTVIPVVHWAIKKMSEYGVDDGFAEKVGACIHILNNEV